MMWERMKSNLGFQFVQNLQSGLFFSPPNILDIRYPDPELFKIYQVKKFPPGPMGSGLPVPSIGMQIPEICQH